MMQKRIEPNINCHVILLWIFWPIIVLFTNFKGIGMKNLKYEIGIAKKSQWQLMFGFFWTYSIPIHLQLCSKAPKTGDPVLSTLKNTLMYDTTWFWSRRTHTQYLSLFKILQSKLSKCRVVPPWAQACWIQGRS